MDFVMEFYGKSFPEAVQMLTGEAGAGKPDACPAPSPDFRLPLHNPTNTKVIKYLTEERKLDWGIVDTFIAAGDIYEDTRHNVVFVGRDCGTQRVPGIPRYAHCRGTADKFRQDVSGSDKACNFSYQGKAPSYLSLKPRLICCLLSAFIPKTGQSAAIFRWEALREKR